jgi:hypothetical protein
MNDLSRAHGKFERALASKSSYRNLSAKTCLKQPKRVSHPCCAAFHPGSPCQGRFKNFDSDAGNGGACCPRIENRDPTVIAIKKLGSLEE